MERILWVLSTSKHGVFENTGAMNINIGIKQKREN